MSSDKLKEWVEVVTSQAPDMPKPNGVFKDASGIELISTESLLDGPVQEGDTVQVVAERTHHDTWGGSRERKKLEISGFGQIEFFVIIDRGEPQDRPNVPRFDGQQVTYWPGPASKAMRFVVAPKALGESLIDVELEYKGVALEGKYFSQDQAGSVVEHLNAISNTHEE